MSEHLEIIEQLKGSDPEQIREAAFAAGDNRVEEAVPLLAGHIESDNLGVQEAVDAALRQIGGSATVQAVIPLLQSDDAPARNIAMDILRDVGAHDFPALVSLLHDEDPDLRIFASDILGTSDNVAAVAPLCDALLKDPEVNVRYQAAVSLGTLGFVEAADCLNKALNDEEWVQFSVIEALTKIGADSSVTALAKALDYSSDLVASMIVEALGEMGNIKAVTILMKHLDNAPAPLRNKIVKAIVNLLGAKSLNLLGDAEREKFRVYLLAALEDEEEDIQDAAMLGLGFLGGAKATAAIMRIASQMDPDRDHERLVRAVECLASIGFNESLADVVREGEEYPVRIAVEAIANMENAEALELLVQVFWDKSRDEQRAIITVLSAVADDSLISFFLDVLDRHSDGNVLKAALLYLGQQHAGDGVGERIFSMLEHPYDDVKEAALEACITQNDPQMNERFKQYYTSPEPLQRLMAVFALGKLDADANIEELSSALEDEVPDIRKVALEVLFEECPDSPERLEIAVPRLQDENREVRLALVEMLGNCHCLNVEPYLTQALADTDDWVVVRAVEALGSRKAVDAVPHLVRLLAEGSTLVRLKTIESLGTIGGKTAFRALMSMMDDEEQEIQEAAELAVQRMREDSGEEV